MNDIYKNGKKLRYGYTTGSCASAAAKAACITLLTKKCPDIIKLTTPKGMVLNLVPQSVMLKNGVASCAIVKDSGDDPDITNGIRIFAYVEKIEQNTIIVKAGYGIGKVTRAGLANPVGSFAINPAPLKQIKDNIKEVLNTYNYDGGICVTICAENGKEIAKQTYNQYLGIVDGISILGTSGIVEPMSEQALIDTIHLELDSLYAEGNKISFLCPGNYGASFAKEILNIDMSKSVKCSNFIGDAIDYSVFCGFEKILLVGHAGKILKIAAGVMNTHSSVADCRQEIFTAHSAICGACSNTLEMLMNSVTTDECIEILKEKGILTNVLESINQRIQKNLERRVRSKIPIEYIMFTNKFGVLSKSKNALSICEELKK